MRTKEFTIEEKAKAYDEAIEKFDVILNLNTVKESGTIFADDVRKILPELQESEDERIINNIRKVIRWYRGMFTEKSLMPEQYQEIDAWLEKQGEQKPAWSEEDERYINIAVSAFSSPSLERLYQYNKVKSNDLINWLNSIKDKILHQKQWKPSDEQLKALKEACDEHWESDGLDPLYTLCEQLKKLREE